MNGIKKYVLTVSLILALKFFIPSLIHRSESITNIIIQEILKKKKCSEENAKSDEIENEETFKRKQEGRKRRKHFFKSLDVDDEEESDPCVSSKTRNEDERFGEWIVLELQSLRSEVNKRKLKSEIRKAICYVADLDNVDIFVSSTSSNHSPLHSPSSPTYTLVSDIKSENA